MMRKKKPVTFGFLLGLWVCLIPSTSFAVAVKKKLTPPFDLKWGATPDAVGNVLGRLARLRTDPAPVPEAAASLGANAAPGVIPAQAGGVSEGSQNVSSQSASQAGGGGNGTPTGVPGTTGMYVSEQHYEGEIFAARADRITPVFLMSQLFGFMVNFPSAPDTPAALLWERIVEQVSRDYGPPKTRTKPSSLLSWNAILQVVPPEANKSALLRIYNEADRNPQLGLYVLQDLQVQTGLWVPEAIWPFQDGGVIKVVMQASGRNEFGLTAVRPLLIILKHDMFR